jgi:hypothetical protein
LAAIVAIILALVATAIWTVSTGGFKALRRWWTYKNARRFWRPLVAGDSKIVLGRFTKIVTKWGELDLTKWEATGLVGMGDVHAATFVESFLDDLGVRRLGQTFDVVDHDQISEDLSDINLICLGGPDVNRVTRNILAKEINNTFRPGVWKKNEIAFHDTMRDKWFSPESDDDEGGRIVVTRDYGLIIRVPNPWNHSRAALIVAGGFGYGTWAGVMLARSAEFLSDERVTQASSVECLYETDVDRGIPQMPRIIDVRPIAVN